MTEIRNERYGGKVSSLNVDKRQMFSLKLNKYLQLILHDLDAIPAQIPTQQTQAQTEIKIHIITM